jgi:hypothetical protein
LNRQEAFHYGPKQFHHLFQYRSIDGFLFYDGTPQPARCIRTDKTSY